MGCLKLSNYSSEPASHLQIYRDENPSFNAFLPKNYLFGYQGSEKNPELGQGSYTTFFRQLNSSLGRWMSPDPVFQPWQSPYSSMGGNPIILNDVDGDCESCKDSEITNVEETGTSRTTTFANGYKKVQSRMIGASGPGAWSEGLWRSPGGLEYPVNPSTQINKKIKVYVFSEKDAQGNDVFTPDQIKLITGVANEISSKNNLGDVLEYVPTTQEEIYNAKLDPYTSYIFDVSNYRHPEQLGSTGQRTLHGDYLMVGGTIYVGSIKRVLNLEKADNSVLINAGRIAVHEVIIHATSQGLSILSGARHDDNNNHFQKYGLGKLELTKAEFTTANTYTFSDFDTFESKYKDIVYAQLNFSNSKVFINGHLSRSLTYQYSHSSITDKSIDYSNRLLSKAVYYFFNDVKHVEHFVK